uniref:Pentatricopeptide repeat-containing protein-mitochondrial domain-containing protein n=1 Tax=Alexandrium monilatum TaxID=311494 RepID=A0A7S4Q7H1_9DINO
MLTHALPLPPTPTYPTGFSVSTYFPLIAKSCVTMNGFVSQVIDVAFAARTELILFCLAFAVHSLLFGNLLPRRLKGAVSRRSSAKPPPPRKASAPRCRKASESSAEGESGPAPLASGCQALQNCASAFHRGDHRAVVRIWSSLRNSEEVPAGRLAQVVESMQRLRTDSSSGILAEACGYLKRNPALCTITYVNQLLEPFARSLDSDFVLAVVHGLPALGLKPDCGTYDLLMQMHFTTRSFEEVSALLQQMRDAGIEPSRRTSLVLLKVALQLGHLDEALEHYREVLAGGAPTASTAPRHLAAQLVDLACREHRVQVVLTAFEKQFAPLTAETLNAMLAECLRARDQEMVRRLERLCANQAVEKNGRTYSLLVRAAGNDGERIAELLDELTAAKSECTSEVVQAVLAACQLTESADLADRVCAMLSPAQVGQASSILALVRFYAEKDCPEKACKLYDAYASDARRRTLVDSRTERCVVGAALKCGRKDLATGLMEAAPADTAKYISMIHACAAKGNLDEAMKTFQALEASGVELTQSLWNTALDACVECRELRRAEGLMRRMEAQGLADVVSYNTLIKAHLRQEHFDRAHSMMEKMRAAGIQPNHVTYNELINAMTRSERDQRRTRVWDVVDEMQRSKVKPNRITCSILLKNLKAKSSHADIVRTLELTDALEEPMDEVLLSSVVEACVRVGRPALLSQRLQRLRGMEAVTVTGAHTFGSLIRAYGYAKDMAGAWRCWQEMRSQHIKPTSITIGCMVEAVVSNGDVDGAYELVSSLLQEPQCRDQVNAVVFGSVLKGYGRSHNAERAFAVFEEMLSLGIEPSAVTYNAMIDVCARNGQMAKARSLLDGMRERNFEPNLITYGTMIKGYTKEGDMPSAFSALESLHSQPSCKPDEAIYSTMLDGCLQAGLSAEGERVFEEMQKHGTPPGNHTVHGMVKLLGQARKLDRAFDVVDAAQRKYRLRPSSQVFNSLTQACLNNRDPVRAAGVCEWSVREGQQLDLRIRQGVVRGLLNAGYRAKAASVLHATYSLSAGEHGGAGSAADAALCAECLQAILAAGDGALAQSLLRDLHAARPRMKLDPALERSVRNATHQGRA